MKQQRPPLFERLQSGLEDLRLYAQGEQELVETKLSIPEPPRSYAAADVTALRSKLQLSQSSMAQLMHVSVKTVQRAGNRESGLLPEWLPGCCRY